jgi:hypothetical protein
MDKHDRPYKCAASGCEKLPGFTYSGGLLRHEREVHGKHGGPKNSFFCPHPNCKRHAGKGFSRQENLNEHLRRVHTQNGTASTTGGTGEAGGGGAETDDGASDNATLAGAAAAGQKRKRDDRGNSDDDNNDGTGSSSSDLREEIKRVRQENEELRRQVQAQTQQTIVMMQKISQLQQALEARLPATAAAVAAVQGGAGVGVVPQAPMASPTML